MIVLTGIDEKCQKNVDNNVNYFKCKLKLYKTFVQGQKETATGRDSCTGILTKVNSREQSNFVSMYHLINPDVVKNDYFRQI